MKANGELERCDLVVDPEIYISDDGDEIEVYLESWFDVDKKFGTHTREDWDNWVNLYAFYKPKEDKLMMEFILAGDFSEYEYKPTAGERRLVIELITEKIKEISGLTPIEYLGLNS